MFRPRPREGWLLAVVVAIGWALIPALPAVWRGDIIGQPYTDLYPSVWGMAQFVAGQPGLPLHTAQFGAPDGIGFYYSSPLHGWAALPLTWMGGTVFAYNASLVLARFATILVAYGAFSAMELQPWGALAAATVYGASPFFHGYAVEGIVEGTDGWTMALWVWMVLKQRRFLAPIAFALTVISSWYLGMVACLLAAGWGVRNRRAWASLVGGMLLATPMLYAFGHAFGGNTPLPDEIRSAMGAHIGIPSPGILAPVNVYALNAYVGFAVILLAAPSMSKNPALVAGVLVCALLSLGQGPWWHLPVLEMVRFPYRWHAGTLFCLAPMVGQTVDRLRFGWLGLLPLIEGLVLGPTEPVLPGAPTSVPALYRDVRGPILLEVPGPVSMPPGVINRSRPRARYLLFYQLSHGAHSPWTLDFNGISTAKNAPWLSSFAAFDPLSKATPGDLDLAGARAGGVSQIMVHRDELAGNAQAFEAALLGGGAVLLSVDGKLALYAL